MKLMNILNKFRDDESGAVTVDWVVLTAAIVGLAIAVIASVESGVNTLADNISSEVSAIEVNADDSGSGSGSGTGTGG